MYLEKVDKIHLNAPIISRFKKGCRYNSRATFNGAGTVSDLKRQKKSVFTEFYLQDFTQSNRSWTDKAFVIIMSCINPKYAHKFRG